MSKEKDNSPKKSRRLPVPDEAEIQPPAPKPAPDPTAKLLSPAVHAAPRPATPPTAATARPMPPPASPEQPRRAPQYHPPATPAPTSSSDSSVGVMLFGAAAIVVVLSIVVNLFRDEFSEKGGGSEEQAVAIASPRIAEQPEASTSAAPEIADADAEEIPLTPVPAVASQEPQVAVVDERALDTTPVAAEPVPPTAIEVSWTCEKGFPFDYAAALSVLENAKESHDDNALHKKQQIQQCEQRLAQTLDDARREQGLESTRLMVIDANPNAVTAIADVTAGWLIDIEENFVGRHWFTSFGRQTGVTWLKPIGSEDQPKIILRAGSQIDAASATAPPIESQYAIDGRHRFRLKVYGNPTSRPALDGLARRGNAPVATMPTA